jgi:hypothetical protein
MNACRNISRLTGWLVVLFIAGIMIAGCSSLFKQDSQVKKEVSIANLKLNQMMNKAYAAAVLTPKDDEAMVHLSPGQPVRAIYVSSYVANSRRIKELTQLIDQTELNAMVIDINSGVSLSAISREGNRASFTPSKNSSAEHFRQVIRQIKQHRIYLIARIVTFKNSSLANAMPAWAIRRKDGSVWRDRRGTPWIDPYRQEAWEYSLAIGDYAARIGFDEVQYDYVRFPENPSKMDKEVAYANPNNWSKSEAIRRFLHRASLRAHKSGVKVSADVFGMVGSSDNDMGIGQKWDSIVKEVDIISPMVYPSHYSEGMWGIASPDLSPGKIIARAMQDTVKRNRKLNRQGIATGNVRPWLQGFTATWVNPHQKYGAAQIREQIRAARKLGFQSYMIWNSSNRYPKFNA